MNIYEALNSDSENLRTYAKVLIDEAIKEQVKKNKGKTEKELEALD